MIKNAADLLAGTIKTLSARAPAIVASAADALGSVKLSLHFGDGSHAWLHRQHSRLLVRKRTLQGLAWKFTSMTAH